MTSRDPVALKERHRLSYQIDALERADGLVGLKGRRVLELGGALSADLVLDTYHARSWVGIDDRTAYAKLTGVRLTPCPKLTPDARPPDSGWAVFDGRCHDLPTGFEGCFDLAFCLATLEHVAGLPRFLDRLATSLAPGGVALLLVGPVWSSWRGHHVFPDYFHPDEDKTRDLLSRLLPWQHLLMSRIDFYRWLARHYGTQFADRCWESIFESARLNRLFYDEYTAAFSASRLSVRNLERANPHPSPEHPEFHFLLDAVRRSHVGRHGFEVDCFWAILDCSIEDSRHPTR